MKNYLQNSVFFSALTIPTVALANVPMVLMYGIGRFTFIPLVLVIEWLVLKYFFELSWGKAAKASIVVNAVTYVVGILAFPVLGMFFYGTPLPDLIGKYIVQGSLGEYLIIMLVAAILDSAIELAVLKFGFKRLLSVRRILVWFVANLATALIVLLGVGFEIGTDILSGRQLDSVEVACIKQKHRTEIAFLRQIGQEAANHSNRQSEDAFHEKWLAENQLYKEIGKFGNFKTLAISSGGRYVLQSSFGDFLSFGTTVDDQGSYTEPGLEIIKMEYVQNGASLTTYDLRLTSKSGNEYSVDAELISDPDCIGAD